MRSLLSLAGSLLMLRSFVFASSVPMLSGNLQVEVKDNAGYLTPQARVYLMNERTRESKEFADPKGFISIDVPPGPYRVYAALAKRAGGGVDRYISAVAHVRVGTEDDTSLILRVDFTHPDRFYLSDDARKKIGLSTELAQYLN